MSSSRSIAAIASLPQTRADGSLGTGRSISLPAAGTGVADEMSMASSHECARRRQITPHSVPLDKSSYVIVWARSRRKGRGAERRLRSGREGCSIRPAPYHREDAVQLSRDELI